MMSLFRVIFPLSVSVLASLIVFFFNLRVNLLKTSLIRGVIVFSIFFVLGLLIQYVLHLNINSSKKDQEVFEPLKFERVEIDNGDKVEELVKGIRTFSEVE
ncbi:hypothetical protein BHF71_00515 [Vulcanibacillus modesticaldus]|uniref:Uncharacterized protein n=1 Tax=Vulcanibacillus modesticaldus TaxID=337097 RepID=A0A1D2YXD7_9BACI|nr:hypothetical protein [Vulcanibacillus modesticaldus]OEG00425.1 hypothetical protein BHF71_00515 [Vulcanibacillus modesticaldus]